MTNEYNDLWEMDRGDYVTLVTELRAALEQAERERDEARAELEMQRIDSEDAQDDADVAEAIDEARQNDMICFVCEVPMRSDQAVTDQDIDNICPKCASETIGTLNYANSTLRAGAEAADDYYQSLVERQRRTIRALVVAARAGVRVVYALAQSCFVSKEACINALRGQLMYAQQAENTAQFRAYLMGKNPGYLKQADRQAGKE